LFEAKDNLSENLVADVSDADFPAEVLESSLPVMVDFWAPWCHPCKSMTSMIEEIASEFEGKIKIVKVNVDEHKEHASNYNVRSIPNFIFVKDGELADQIVGAVAKQELVTAISKLV